MAEARDPHHDATRPLAPLPRVGPYRVEGELGRGGMGVVFRAFDERLHRDVALKALPASVASDPHERGRLESEAAWDLLPSAAPAVAELVRSCLAKDREQRPSSMDEARRRLDDAVAASGGTVVVAPRHHLPAEHDTFVGREDDLAFLEQRVIGDRTRLLSVLGLGGTGKTRLVLRFAHANLGTWPGGAWFCDLSGARSALEEAERLAAATAVGIRPAFRRELARVRDLVDRGAAPAS